MNLPNQSQPIARNPYALYGSFNSYQYDSYQGVSPSMICYMCEDLPFPANLICKASCINPAKPPA